eukprot:gene31545-53864_t
MKGTPLFPQCGFSSKAVAILDHLGVTTQAFDDDLVLQQLVDHAGRVGVRLVDLVDRHDDRNPGRLGVLDGLDRLRHHGVIGGNHQHNDIRALSPARTRRGKGRVAGGGGGVDVRAFPARGGVLGQDGDAPVAFDGVDDAIERER